MWGISSWLNSSGCFTERQRQYWRHKTEGMEVRKREIHEHDWIDVLNTDIGRSFSPVSFRILEAWAKIKFASKPDEGKTLEARLFFFFLFLIPHSCKWLRSGEECVDNRTAVRTGSLTSRTKTPQSLSFFCWGIPWSNKTSQIKREYSNKTVTATAYTFLLVWIYGTYCTCSYMVDLVWFFF